MLSLPPEHLRAEIDLGALRHNLRELRRRAGGAEVMGIVKADAYGHGLEHVVPVLREEGVGHFAVARVSEGVRLRALGVTEPVLVLSAPLPGELPAYAAHGLEASVTSAAVAEAVAAFGGGLRVHLEVDTGMHRLGVRPEEAAAVLRRLREAPGLEVAAVWTHFATADEATAGGAEPAFAREQLARFAEVEAAAAGTPVHIANSGGLLQVPASVEGRAFVRPGGLLYGIPPSEAVAARADVRPVMRLVARVLHVQTVAPGETVSYGRTWRAERPTRIATLAAGYGDGLPRQLSNRGEVGLGGRRARIVGRVCMDLMMVELGAPGGPGAEVEVGDEAVLLGPGGPSALEVAAWAGTIAYAVPCGLTARVPRVRAGQGPA